MKIHKDLEVWKASVEFVSEVYRVSRLFPKEEMYGLTNQMRRASVSVPSNIAEGASRHTNKAYIQFLYITMGSLQELDTQLIIALNLGYMKEESYNIMALKIDEIGKMLSGLIRYRKSKRQ